MMKFTNAPRFGGGYVYVGGGYVYEGSPERGYVGWPASAQPHIKANHIDGPMVTFRNGEMHWLTLWERILFRLGRVDAHSLERKYRPHLLDLSKCALRPPAIASTDPTTE